MHRKSNEGFLGKVPGILSDEFVRFFDVSRNQEGKNDDFVYRTGIALHNFLGLLDSVIRSRDSVVQPRQVVETLM
jgi:hypothetical protein